MKVLDCLLSGQAEGVLVCVVRVGHAGVTPACEEEDAVEDGHPVTDWQTGRKESDALEDSEGYTVHQLLQQSHKEMDWVIEWF